MTTLAAPPARRIPTAVALVLPALLFGLLVATQWRTQADRSDLSVRYNAPLLDAAQSLQAEQNTLKSQLAELRAGLDAIQRSSSSQDALAQQLQARIDELRAAAGLTERSGQGVVITLDDTRSPTSVPAGDIDRAICHSTDITDIINAAWRGGALAIGVNDERVVGSTSVYCVGSTIMVNGTLMSPPFAISVIGPQDQLMAAFDDPTQLVDIKQRRDVYGLGFRVTRASSARVPAYTGALNVRDARAR